MSENNHSKKKIDHAFRLVMGLGITVGSANLIWILTSEHQIMIVVLEAALGIALLGYSMRRAGLNQRKSDEQTALSEQKYLQFLEDQKNPASVFKSK